MPKKLEQKLQREAKRKGFSKQRTAKYVYGTLEKIKQKKRRVL